MLSEESDCDQYWSAIEPVLVTYSNQYWSHIATSTGHRAK